MAQFAAREMILHITMVYRLHGQTCQNGFYFTNRGAMSDDFLDERVLALGVDFSNRMLPIYAAFQNNQVEYRGLVVVTLNPANGPMAEIIPHISGGFQGDESLPSYSAAIISLRTGFSGKTNRGRIYIGGIGENEHSAGELVPDAFTALHDFGNELSARYGPSGSSPYFSHIIFSKKFGYSNGVWSPAGVRVITHYIPRKTLGTCRHRLIGHGT